jgi:hypothetical protein
LTSRFWTNEDEDICKEIIQKNYDLTKEQVWNNPDFRNRFIPGLSESNFITLHTSSIKKTMNRPSSQIATRYPNKLLSLRYVTVG